MIVAIPKESGQERRVALIPRTVKALTDWGLDVQVECGAGEGAGFRDRDYIDNGAAIVDQQLWETADLVLKVAPPTVDELQRLKQQAIIVGFFQPYDNQELLAVAQQQKVSVLAMDCMPRTSVAQRMDALSVMANIAGYKAVILASNLYRNFVPGRITSAGRNDPATVLVIGAGVAGLSAISTAKGLGAEVYAFDTRREVQEQVQSVGGKFIVIDDHEDGSGDGGYAKEMSEEFVNRERDLLASKYLPRTSIVITTAVVPGKPAPILLTKQMVESMARGSVIVDLAAQQGGNCELTVQDKVVEHAGVTIAGPSDLPSQLASQASVFYSNNIYHLLRRLNDDGRQQIAIDLEDSLVASIAICHDGKLHWPPPSPSPLPTIRKLPVEPAMQPTPSTGGGKVAFGLAKLVWAIPIVIGVSLLLMLGKYAPADLLARLTVFVLACIIGWQVVWNVTPALHTPLMSVTNAISGIVVIGAMMQLQIPTIGVATLLAIIAVLIATINVAGGFHVTWRMLKMFRK